MLALLPHTIQRIIGRRLCKKLGRAARSPSSHPQDRGWGSGREGGAQLGTEEGATVGCHGRLSPAGVQRGSAERAVEPGSLPRVGGGGDHAHGPGAAAASAVASGLRLAVPNEAQTVAKAPRLDAHHVLGAAGRAGENPTQQTPKTALAAPQGLCLASWAAFPVPRSPQRWVQAGGPVTHFPRPGGLGPPSLLRQSLFCSLAGFSSQPLCLLSCKLKVLRCFSGPSCAQGKAGTGRHL